MGVREIQQNLRWMDASLNSIGKWADAPTVWQRLDPDQQAKKMNEFRELLLLRHTADWPDAPRPELFDKLAKEGNERGFYDLRHEHATPPADLHHWHQQVHVVVDADTPLHRGQLLTWDLDNPTDLDTRSPRAVPATIANTLLKRNCLLYTSDAADE